MNARMALSVVSCLLLSFAVACGGGSSSNSSGNGGGGNSGGGSSTTANTVTVSVNAGPSTLHRYTNGIFVSVTVCKPGTSTCVTVPDVLLDTGSTGLRLLSSTVSSLGLQNASSNGKTLGNCVQYLDNSYNWGPVTTADVQFSGEVASSLPIQLIAEPSFNFVAAPAGCGGTANNSVDSLLANGILGVSFYREDCGSACAPGTTYNPGNYYYCSSSACTETTIALNSQLQNPIALFPSDNNGLMLTLPSVDPSGAASATGTLTFGIGTQSDNALGSATVLTPDNYGNIKSTLKSTSTNVGFFDTGSSALYFLDAASSGIPECSTYQGYYCPSSVQSLTATNRGANSNSTTVSFSVGNAESLLNSSADVFSDLAGTGTDATIGPYFDWGLPFFFGRTVYVALEGKSAGGVAGPYWAY